MTFERSNEGNAPGKPGITPRWTSSKKAGVGTAITTGSRLWFSVSHGIINEIYYPEVDCADVRDFGLMITDGQVFFSEEKRDTEHKIEPLKPGVPGYLLTNTCKQGRYRITKTVFTDSLREVLLQNIKFEVLKGSLSDYHLYALLAPHVNDQGAENNGWIGVYKGVPMLFAQRGDVALALASSAPFAARSCGFVGRSDGWTDIHKHFQMKWFYPRASHGNIALTAEIDLNACQGNFTLGLGFGEKPDEAGQRVRATLLEKTDCVMRRYTQGWEDFQGTCLALGQADEKGLHPYRISTAVLRTHEAKRFPGGMIASLSIPWGFSKGDQDLAGYHVVWPRDLVQSAAGLLAAGEASGARRTFFYLMSTQDADGHWPQNMWLDGRPYWHGIQMDGTGFVILLADLLRREGELADLKPWPTVRAAAQYLVQNGPECQQDRWEENSGFSTYTMAVEIAALLATADFADEANEKKLACYLRETADVWNADIDRWTYATGTDLAKKCGVDEYYVRIAPPSILKAESINDVTVRIKNQPADKATLPATAVVSPDALALVRFGLRAADDPRILNTVKVIDATLKTETSTGPVWHRYTRDGYGESESGAAFDDSGIGRGWPLLCGERAHFELANGNRQEAMRLRDVMSRQTSPGGLLPEQIWDAADIPERELFNGHPSGSGMPLVWAHAEYVKLVRSLHEEECFDTPPQTVHRYQVQKTKALFSEWRFNHRARHILQGTSLRVGLLASALVHWSCDNWKAATDTSTEDSGLGLYFADLNTSKLPAGAKVTFTFFWRDANRWEGSNYEVAVVKNAHEGVHEEIGHQRRKKSVAPGR